MDTLTGLAHPNIVQLIGLCIETDDMYIVTEFVGGGDLRSKLKETNVVIDWPTRLGIARDIALAMNYLHSKGIMHRDLKSHNLLVGESWKIKVCDFGLARSAPSDDNSLMTIVGTNEWMAPEVAMGEKYDQSADVFSYAMVLYEIIARDKPPARQLNQMYAFLPNDHKPKIPSDTPEKLWNLLVECSALQPEDRPLFKDVVKRVADLIKEYSASGAGAATSPAQSAPAKDSSGSNGDSKSSDKKAATPKVTKKKTTKKKKSTKDGSPSASSPTTKKKRKPSKDEGTKKKATLKKSSSGDKKTTKKTTTKKTTTKKAATKK